MSRIHNLVGIVVVSLALCGTAAAELKPVHQALKSPKAQANREEVFRLLMNGTTPSWLKGKSSAAIRQRTEAIRTAVYENGRKVVKKIVENPSAKPSASESKVLGLLSPTQRAQLLKEEAGFQVEKVKFKVDGQPTTKLKITLKRFGYDEYSYGTQPSTDYTKQMSIYHRVMTPNSIAYVPAGYHSKYLNHGEVIDLWGNSSSGYGALRPNDKPFFPTWMSDAEAKNMKTVFDVGNSSWSSALGDKLAHGRPGMWPPAATTKKTGNSCTTTFIRAPIGERQGAYAWIDELQAKVTAAAVAGRIRIDGVDLKKQTLLEAVTGKKPEKTDQIFAAVKTALRGEARNLDKLRGEVTFFFDKLKSQPNSYSYPPVAPNTCTFPMELMHRTPLAELAGIKGDPVGPGMATQKFRSADPTRIGVVTVFEKGPARRW
jgi:hypothetical protein